MTREEAKKVFDEFLAKGGTEEEIASRLYFMFQEDKINLEELENLLDVLGWEFTEEFKAMSPEDQKTKGFEEN